jgi:O-antigen/teichoic acid export membrane protein
MALTRREQRLAAYRAGSDLLGRVAFLVITVVAARRLSTDSFGLFMLGTTLGWLAAVASDFGIQMHVGRAISRQPQRASELLARWFTVRVASSLAALAAALAFVATGWAPPGATMPLALLVVVSLIVGLVEFLHYVYRALGRTDVESTVTLALRGGSLFCALVALWWHADVTWLAAALLVGPALALAYSLRLARHLSARVSVAAADGTSTIAWRSSVREFQTSIAPIGFGILLSALYFRIDAFLIEHWRGIEAVALYTAAFRVVDALRLFPAAVLAVALPAMCRATDLRIVRSLAVQLTAGAGIGALVLWMLAPAFVPALYGPAYAPAITSFRILLLAFPLMALNYAMTQQLIGWNGSRAFAICCAVALAANLALNAQLIPIWSIEGAAWATLGTEAVLTFGCLGALATRRRRIESEWRDLETTWQGA